MQTDANTVTFNPFLDLFGLLSSDNQVTHNSFLVKFQDNKSLVNKIKCFFEIILLNKYVLSCAITN